MVGIVVILQLSHDGDCRDGTESVYAAEDLIRLKTLSPRETQTLELLSKGFLYKEIGNKLTIAEGTVKQHTHNIYKKLQVNNCIEAIRKYLNF